ncbi:unnamed protein product [Rotaria sp. Silwood2]|nr:unnamed protein product [Rotaria sp. Silwood2]CAF2646958.1 unnamed protein product [Rotaria sp. Silwood2]CAF2866257.1 unnamed protein product [Rotaria sp. Silwood2]CAF3039910.1 unnamed protein product [Rotaria sp. Silwood2]CAF4166475.1 unnamed protein product [Rotaria sp. Silwood2]
MYNTSGSDIDTEEFEYHSGSRKVAKTYVEKKRRDRINRSLDELKDLLAIHCDKARYQKLEKAEILEMCVDFVKQTNVHLNSIKHNYELGYQQCTNDITTFLNTIPEISFIQRQHLLKHLSTSNNRRFHPYRQTTSHHSIVNEWFNRCGGGKQKSLPDSSSERSNTSSPSSFDDNSERSSSLWRPW